MAKIKNAAAPQPMEAHVVAVSVAASAKRTRKHFESEFISNAVLEARHSRAQAEAEPWIFSSESESSEETTRT